MPVLTSPPLVGGAGKPVTGVVVLSVTAPYEWTDSLGVVHHVTTTPQQGVVRGGQFFDLDANDPLMLPPTPEGVGMRIVLELSQHGAVRGEHRVSRVVQVPDQPTVAWADLVDVVPPVSGGDYIVPPWAADILVARDDARVAATDAAGSATAAEAAQASVEAVAGLGTRGVERRIYVRATAGAGGDGKTVETAYREIRDAVSSLSANGPVIRGSVVIDVGAGTYKGGIALPTTRGAAQDDFIKIIGPAAGHPNAPTAIIDHSADTAQTRGFLATEGRTVWLEDIKFTGPFAQGVDIRDRSYLQWRNVHVDGAAVGLNLVNNSKYAVAGGLIENCGQGISELFGIVRDFSGAATAADQLLIRACTIGVKAKENCVGHFDAVRVEDCSVGIELQLFSGANMRRVEFRRNTLGITLTNSEIHNETSIVWGTGADANTRRILSVGNSSELAFTGWESVVDGAPTVRTGHRPLVLIASDYADKAVGSATTEQSIANWATILRADWFAIKGKRARFVLWGTTTSNNPMNAAYRVLLRVRNSLAAEVSLPAGLAAGSHFRIEFEMVAAADGASQKFVGALTCQGASAAYTASRAFDLSTADASVAFAAIPGNAADSVTFKLAEVWG